ncbi:MAG: hypothetical protein F6K30_05190 [Cyanothece sp. SIO2G6]|nr:hypothetical protein [Cyanothece sp. SIO2G6]
MSSITSPDNLQPYQQQVLAGLFQINQRLMTLDETVSTVQTDAGTLKSDVDTLKADIDTLKANIEKIEYKLDVAQKSSNQVSSLAKTIVFAVAVVALLSPILQDLSPSITEYVTQFLSNLSNKAVELDLPLS